MLLPFFWGTIDGQVLNKSQAQALVPESEFVRLNAQNSLIEQVKFSKGKVVDKKASPVNLFLTNTPGTRRGYGFKAGKVKKDHIGYDHINTVQTYRGIPVYGAVFHLHYKGKELESVHGKYVNLKLPSDIPGLSYQKAHKAAMDYVDAKEYLWEVDASVDNKRIGELFYLSLDGEKGVMTYRFDIFSTRPMSRQYIFVDANSGEVVKTLNRIQEVDELGIANTRYNGVKGIRTSHNGSHYVLSEGGRCGISTFDMNQGTDYGTSVDFTDDDNQWDATSDFDDAAYDAHFGTEATYDYYLEKHRRNSIDDQGSEMVSYVHYRNGYVNAFWNGSFMTYGDGDGVDYFPLTCIDIVAHEITHGVTEYSAGLEYSYESGALNESFSDIMGVCVDFYANPSTANWLMGEQISLIGKPLRSMENPKTEDQPDTYPGQNWYFGSGDYGGVHYNSGVQNFWFYLLVNGGSGSNDNGDFYSVEGIGLEKAAAIAYRNLSVYLGPTSKYADARTYSIQSAEDLHGQCSPEVQAVTNAWYAVGV